MIPYLELALESGNGKYFIENWSLVDLYSKRNRFNLLQHLGKIKKTEFLLVGIH